MSPRESAAYHEAGHAVAGVLCGVRLLFVQVDEDAAGRCDFQSSTLTGERQIRIAMAGPAAEYIFRHPGACGFALADCNASDDDLADIARYCDSYPPDQRQQIREQHWASTCQVLRAKWSVVQEVARKIIDEPVVYGVVVVGLLDSRQNQTCTHLLSDG